MAAPPSAYQDRHFLAVIGDEVGSRFLLTMGLMRLSLCNTQDSVTGLLLAGIGVQHKTLNVAATQN